MIAKIRKKIFKKSYYYALNKLGQVDEQFKSNKFTNFVAGVCYLGLSAPAVLIATLFEE